MHREADGYRASGRRLTIGNLAVLSVGLYVATVLMFGSDAEMLFISQLAFILMAGFGVLYVLTRGSLPNIVPISMWLLAVMLLSFFSVIWAVDRESAISKCFTVLQLVVLALIVFAIVDTRKKLYTAVICIIIAGYGMYAYSAVKYGISEMLMMINDEGRIGGEINQENSFGLYSAIVFVLVLYEVLYREKKAFIVLLPLPVIMALASGSKKSALLLVVMSFVMIVFKYRRRRILRIAGATAVIGGATAILYYSGVLDTLLARVDLMTSGSDESTTLRMDYIKFGFEAFKQRPILGYGIEQFSTLYSRAGHDNSPSHNNYIQLLTSFGVTGLLVWYSSYLIVFRNGIRRFYRDSLAPLVTFFVLLTLVSDLTTTTLINKMTYVIIALCFSALTVMNEERLSRGVSKDGVEQNG